jgi:dihydropteroate synthase-like protein
VQRLRARGLRVSIDSFEPAEIAAATRAGAELVLSVNRANRHAAPDWNAEVVVVPDRPGDLDSMDDTIDWLTARHVPVRLDPIIQPIGMGFADSLLGYAQARRRWPGLPLMMGVGNLTELSDVDSCGVNFLLAAICQEWSIRSVLTTQVINWARSSVRELDIARRVVAFAQRNRVPPKHLDPRLIVLRDCAPVRFEAEEIQRLSQAIKDRNYRILLSAAGLHLLGGGEGFTGEDPFELFDALAARHGDTLSPAHAFYLGYEMCKAALARQLDKNYHQDESLDWGFLTIPEPNRHRLKK